MKNLREILAATAITLSAIISGCTSVPKQGQFDSERTVLSPYGGPGHPAVMAIYSGKIKCEKITENGKIIGFRTTRNHWLAGEGETKDIYLPKNAEYIGLTQSGGKIFTRYKLNNREYIDEYSFGLSSDAKKLKLKKKRIYQPDSNKWEIELKQ